ncbi:MAG: hypothetical protein RLZZ618_942 [Pseudomonadota bacterium]|jgi:hypothetical protein
MIRPPEYDNLIRTRALEAVAPTPGAVTAYLKSARSYLSAAKAADVNESGPVFTLAYEGLFLVVQSVLEFHEVRTKDAGRNLAIQRVCTDLQFSPAEFRLMIKAHDRRNAITYRSPFPPVSQPEAMALVGILEKYLPIAHALTNTPP